MGRRGSVPDHRQACSQSRSPANIRKALVVQQDDASAKQRSGLREGGRWVAGYIAANTDTKATATTREVAEELVKIRKHKLAME